MSKLIPTYIEQGLRIEHLERKLAEAQEEAERYRWLRDNSYNVQIGLERELAEAQEQLRLCNIDQFTTAAELADAVAKERERCAEVVEQYTGAWDDEGFALAAKIRKGE